MLIIQKYIYWSDNFLIISCHNLQILVVIFSNQFVVYWEAELRVSALFFLQNWINCLCKEGRGCLVISKILFEHLMVKIAWTVALNFQLFLTLMIPFLIVQRFLQQIEKEENQFFLFLHLLVKIFKKICLFYYFYIFIHDNKKFNDFF